MCGYGFGLQHLCPLGLLGILGDMSPLLTKDCICFWYVFNMFSICHTACKILPSFLSGKEGSILHLDLQRCISYIHEHFQFVWSFNTQGYRILYIYILDLQRCILYIHEHFQFVWSFNTQGHRILYIYILYILHICQIVIYQNYPVYVQCKLFIWAPHGDLARWG